MQKRVKRIKRIKYKRRRKAQPIKGIKPHIVYRPKMHKKHVYPEGAPMPHREHKRRDVRPAPMRAYARYKPPHNKSQPIKPVSPHFVYNPKTIIHWDIKRILLYVALALLSCGLVFLLYYLLN